MEMSDTNVIPLRNVYFMLTYAFRCLRQASYADLDAKEFPDAKNLFAAILGKGISQAVKQGLYREYAENREASPVVRGKLCFPETIRIRCQNKRDVFCEFDDFSEDNLSNRILKTTMEILLRDKTIKPDLRDQLKNNLFYFGQVGEVNPTQISWSTIRFQRNNLIYEMLLSICHLFLDNMLQISEQGKYHVAQFPQEFLYDVYENFVFEFIKQDMKGKPGYEELQVRHGAPLKWKVPEDQVQNENLPTMITDIMLQQGQKTLIIDTKCYREIFQQNLNKKTLRSQHLYQIFAYVKNCGIEGASGLLLYAETVNERIDDKDKFQFNMDGNMISARTLDLSKDFESIKNQLKSIIDDSFLGKR